MTKSFFKPVAAVSAVLACASIGLLAQAATAPADSSALKTTGIYITYDGRKGVVQDGGKAADWLVAAGQGDSVAAYNLGVRADIGDGIPADKAEAAKWYRQAADKGHDYAQSNLGMLYDKGQGVAKDSVEAVKLYRLAAEAGVAPAQTNLGAHYGNGDGIARDDVQAYLWLSLATAQGNVTASRGLETVTKRLSPAQLAEGKKLVAEWKPKSAAAAAPAAAPAAPAAPAADAEAGMGGGMGGGGGGMGGGGGGMGGGAP